MNLTCAMRFSPEVEPAQIEDKKIRKSSRSWALRIFSTVKNSPGSLRSVLIDFQGARSAMLEMAALARPVADPSAPGSAHAPPSVVNRLLSSHAWPSGRPHQICLGAIRLRRQADAPYQGGCLPRRNGMDPISNERKRVETQAVAPGQSCNRMEIPPC